MDSVFGLNKEQQKAFNRLVKAYKDCEKLKVMFVNNYGIMEAYNKEYIQQYTDRMMIDAENLEDAISSYDFMSSNTFKTDAGWADDEHLIVLTEKGKKLFNEDKN